MRCKPFPCGTRKGRVARVNGKEADLSDFTKILESLGGGLAGLGQGGYVAVFANVRVFGVFINETVAQSFVDEQDDPSLFGVFPLEDPE